MAIDDYAQAQELMRKMKAQVPIPARATKEFVRVMKPHRPKFKRDQELSIKSLFYAGDEGGITCDVTPPESNLAIVCSLTQLRIAPDHPLAKEIRAYQKARKEGIAQEGRVSGSVFRPPSTNVRPRKKKRRRRRR
ncbi:MAG: hypothetical protein GY832_38995 [Chloroflexi bacterium]|nr:hypothetical protein [Chloroflexota bacterium]